MPQMDRLMEGLVQLLDRVDLVEGELRSRLAETVDSAQDLFGADGAGLMLLKPTGGLGLAEASNPHAEALERAQEQLGEGPGIESTRRRAVVSVADVRDDSRWPRLADALAGSSVRSILSAPVWLRGQPAGNLNLLGCKPREWTAADGQALSAYAGVVTAFLRIAIDAGHDDPVVEQLSLLPG
jgi:GAF domain-containing protein